eukprot:TRINITY_DN13604_c0_g1_i1.p1 TRINITY_DN13604_c0_g1~~TRINITY_DN13604_c0_g1_i1.p1  ORF type:complete len:444 (-),score=63.18 TRINITY_DN13604_c0_g1_i1:24-1355(-)
MAIAAASSLSQSSLSKAPFAFIQACAAIHPVGSQQFVLRRCKTDVTAGHLSNISATGSCQVAFANQEKRLQRRCSRLQSLLRRTPWSPISHFSAFGKMWLLPKLKPDADDLRPLSSEVKLDYLAGFFDGDGCVTTTTSKSSCMLAIGQSFDRAEALILFQQEFGGSIYLHSEGRGVGKPCVQWTVRGVDAQLAARRLAERCCLKQAQLKIASTWPTCTAKRSDLVVELKHHKHHNHITSQSIMSWAFVAGFFDAEGYIGIPARYASMELRVVQKNRAVLKALHTFLSSHQPDKWTLFSTRSQSNDLHTLRCAGPAAREALHCMVLNGLVVKREQAELALTLTSENHSAIREAMSHMSGNQSCYRRLDAEGVANAKQIHSLQKLIRRASTSGRFSDLQSHEIKLSQLLQEHSTKRLAAKEAALRRDIRNLIRRGQLSDQVGVSN